MKCVASVSNVSLHWLLFCVSRRRVFPTLSCLGEPEGSIGEETAYTPRSVKVEINMHRVPSVATRMYRLAVKRFTAFCDFVVLTVPLFVGWSC